MSPKPIVESSKHVYTLSCDCDACASFTRFRARNPHLYGYADPPHAEHRAKLRAIRRTLILSIIIFALCAAAALIWISAAQAHPRVIHPVPAPRSLVRARAVCPLDKPLKCRAALVHAYDAIAWARKQRHHATRLAPLQHLAAWTCIHNGTPVTGGKPYTVGQGEAAWNDTGDPYWGGLQMDRSFMNTYGSDMIQRHHGGLADTWTPREQIIVAERAYDAGRGYAPWPNTARACGLIS